MMAYFVDGNTGAVITSLDGTTPGFPTIEAARERAGQVLQGLHGVALRRDNPDNWDGPTLFVGTTQSGTVYLAHRHGDGQRWALERRNSDGTYQLYPQVSIIHLEEGHNAAFLLDIPDSTSTAMLHTTAMVSVANDRDDHHLRVRNDCGKLGEDGQVILEG